MVMNLYSAFSYDIFKCALQASDLWVRSDIGLYRRRWHPLSSSTLMNYIFCDDGLSETTRARCAVEPYQKGTNWYKSNPDFNSDGQPSWRSLTFGIFQKRDKETKGTSKWKLIPLEK